MLKNRLLIAISGKSRVGKDTAADFLCEKISFKKRLSFAAAIYDITEFSQKRLLKPVEKDPKALQKLGECFKEIYGRDVWKNVVKDEINSCDGNIIVTDLRFKTDFQMLKSMGFFIIRINRKDRIIDRDPNHISEIDLDDCNEFDIIIDNDISLDNLKRSIDYIVQTKLNFIKDNN